MFGGAFIDEGTYGCIFLPPLLCSGESKANVKQNSVSKISEYKDAVGDELRTLKRIRERIPLAPAYFSIPFSSDLCHLNKNQTTPPDELNKCKILREHPIDSPRLWSFKMNYAGEKDHEQGLFSSPDALWRYGKNLLEGLTLLMVNGFVHGDLHSGNILVYGNYLPRIIDFGFTQDAYSITAKQLYELFNPSSIRDPYLLGYTQYPPEQCIFKAVNDGASPLTTIDRFMDTKERQRLLNQISIIYGEKQETIRNELIEFINSSISLKRKDYKLFWKSNWNKYDSYGAGYILIRKLGRLYSAGKISEDPAHMQNIKRAIRGLCNLNPMKRLNPAEALAIWDSPQNQILVNYASGWF